MKKKITIIGVGNCGSQVALLAEKKYPDIFDCLYFNTSESDLAMVDVENACKFKIGDREEVEGSGKNREKMKKYLQDDINSILMDQNFQETIYTKKYVFIVTSAAGGTGSGSSPVMMEIFRQMFPDTHFILVGVLPQISSSLMEQGNTIYFLNELYEELGNNTTYMIYDNESTSDMPSTKSLEFVNENIVEDLRILSGVDNYSTPYESIDEADMESIITTPGRLLVVRLNKKITEKNMEDNNLDEIIIKSIKQSTHAETDRNKKVVRWGIITYFTDSVNNLYIPNFEKLADFIGTPIERFNHNAINNGDESLNFLYMIASGLSPINDRVRKINDRIERLKSVLVSDESSKYILSGENTSYDVIEARRKADKRANAQEEINTAEIFKKFRRE